MKKQRFNDTLIRKFESIQPTNDTKSWPSGILAVIEGPCMEIERVNENNRFYPRSLAENRILNNPDTVHLIENRALLGEGRHPQDRFEVQYTEVALLVEKLWIEDQDDGTCDMWGRFAVLDTPVGRILKTLIDVGSSIGISARAMGTSMSRDDGSMLMCEEDYTFFTFDAVPEPGFKSARLSPIMESKIHDNVDSMLENYNSAELDMTKSLLESINPEFFAEQISKVDELRSRKDNNARDLLEQSQRKINSLEKALEREKKRSRPSRIITETRLPSSVIETIKTTQLSLEESEQGKQALQKRLESKDRAINRLKVLLEESRKSSFKLKLANERLEKLTKSQTQTEPKNLHLESKVLELNEKLEKKKEDERSLSLALESAQITALSALSGMSELRVKELVKEVKEPLDVIAERLKRLNRKETQREQTEVRIKPSVSNAEDSMLEGMLERSLRM